MARRVKDIGAWQRAFEIVGALSIMTNCGVLALSPVMQSRFGLIESVPNVDDIQESHPEKVSVEFWVLAFVAVEHILLGLRFVLHKAIPDRPEWVRIELARKMYESRKALKYEVCTLEIKNVYLTYIFNIIYRDIKNIRRYSQDGLRLCMDRIRKTIAQIINNNTCKNMYINRLIYLEIKFL